MIAQDTVLVQLLRLIDRVPSPPPPVSRGRGRPIVYSDGLFLKALVIMVVRRLHKVGELLAVLEEPTPEMRSLRGLLSEGGTSLPGAPSSAGSRPCPTFWPSVSDAWDVTWWNCLGRGRNRGGRWRWTVLCFGPKAGCGTRKTGREAWCPTPP